MKNWFSRMRVVVLLVCVILCVVFAVVYLQNQLNSRGNQAIEIAGNRLSLDIADTEVEREKGLTGVSTLAPDSGMLFKNDEDVLTGFWMKDCVIPLDIIFLNSSGVIVDIKKNFQPCIIEDSNMNCPVYIPLSKYRNAIEVKAGFSDLHNVKVGDSVTFVP